MLAMISLVRNVWFLLVICIDHKAISFTIPSFQDALYKTFQSEKEFYFNLFQMNMRVNHNFHMYIRV